jgi:predicted small lipoprotein YifL
MTRANKGGTVKRLGLIAAVLLLAGCGWRIGPINYPPAPAGAIEPSQVTVKRVNSVMGLFVPMVFTINGVETYGLWTDESYTFMLDPGEYIFGYYLGFNECRRSIRIRARPSQLVYLGPPCKIRHAGDAPR